MTFRGFLKTLSYILGIFITVLILSGISYLIIDGINTHETTVMAYLIETSSPLLVLKTSINQPDRVGPRPKPIMFKIKKNSAVDIARIWMGARVCAIAKQGPR